MNSTNTNTSAQACPHCPQSQVLVWQDRRRCLSCGSWLEDNQHISTYYVVNRALHILLNHGFLGGLNGGDGRINKEVVFAKQRMVDQQRLEFQLPDSHQNSPVKCSMRWFKLDERANYQYLHKASSRVVNNRQVPEVVRSAAGQLAVANSSPGSLRFTEVNLAGDFEGRKFIRMEQSYALEEVSAGELSLIVRLEFSWA